MGSIAGIISSIDAELDRLQKVKHLLSGGGGVPSPFSAKRGYKPRKKRVLSAEARAKIAAAQKKRWAKLRARKKA